MSIVQNIITNYIEEKDIIKAKDYYLSIQKEYFPNAKLVANAQTGPKAIMSLSV